MSLQHKPKPTFDHALFLGINGEDFAVAVPGLLVLPESQVRPPHVHVRLDAVGVGLAANKSHTHIHMLYAHLVTEPTAQA